MAIRVACMLMSRMPHAKVRGLVSVSNHAAAASASAAAAHLQPVPFSKVTKAHQEEQFRPKVTHICTAEVQ